MIDNTPSVTTFTALAVSRGKGANAHTKMVLAVNQGAYVGALVGASVGRKAHIDALVSRDQSAMAHAVAGAQYARPMATIVAISARPFTFSETAGGIPRADWLRLREELKHDSKACAKARAVFDAVQAHADTLRAKTARALAISPQEVAALHEEVAALHEATS